MALLLMLYKFMYVPSSQLTIIKARYYSKYCYSIFCCSLKALSPIQLSVFLKLEDAYNFYQRSGNIFRINDFVLITIALNCTRFNTVLYVYQLSMVLYYDCQRGILYFKPKNGRGRYQGVDAM